MDKFFVFRAYNSYSKSITIHLKMMALKFVLSIPFGEDREVCCVGGTITSPSSIPGSSD
jgi:hypothetical protein